MNNLFEMMMQAQNGKAADNLARQFGLSPQQTQQAIELLMPAFSEGLKRNTADPMGLAKFMSALSGGHHAQFHEDAGAAFRADAIDEGNAILGQLFGSKDTSRALADHVAFSSGIGSSVLKQMLPVIANMVMGGLFKGTQTRTQNRANPMDDFLGSIVENMFGGGKNQPQARAEPTRTEKPQANPFNPFDMNPGGPTGNPFEQMSAGDNPFGKMMEDFLGGQMGREPQAPREEYRTPERGEDIFGDMFETGRKMQDDYQRGVESIFDNYLKGMKRL